MCLTSGSVVVVSSKCCVAQPDCSGIEDLIVRNLGFWGCGLIWWACMCNSYGVLCCLVEDPCFAVSAVVLWRISQILR